MGRSELVDLLLRPWAVVVLMIVVLGGAFTLAMSFDPAGFDRCEAVPTEAQDRAQRRIFGAAGAMAIPALVLLVAGHRRERRRGTASVPRLILAVVVVCALGGLAGTWAATPIDRSAVEARC